ncbi:MAG TPA: hypothetical protein ENI66_01870 [Candidatus Yonathbacteria bacterium]|nr:hypothetical protein [Candidatus Yonathbacteria bacterium]
MNTERTSLFLMANLGAEVSRIISARDRGDIVASHSALLRAEKMLEQIKKIVDMKPRTIELDALGVALRSCAKNNEEERVSTTHIKSYFIPFAVRMLKNRVR